MSTTDRQRLITIEAFCQEYFGYTPSAEELAHLEEEMQAFCREQGHVWFRDGRPVLPVDGHGGTEPL